MDAAHLERLHLLSDARQLGLEVATLSDGLADLTPDRFEATQGPAPIPHCEHRFAEARLVEWCFGYEHTEIQGQTNLRGPPFGPRLRGLFALSSRTIWWASSSPASSSSCCSGGSGSIGLFLV